MTWYSLKIVCFNWTLEHTKYYTQLREWTIHLLHECIIMRVEEAIISLKWMKIGGFPFNEKVLSRAENVYDVINQLWLFL